MRPVWISIRSLNDNGLYFIASVCARSFLFFVGGRDWIDTGA
jgi:hypothetical protein